MLLEEKVMGMPHDVDAVVRRSLTVKWEQGLHLRPAQQIASVAKRYTCAMTFVRDSRTADARNIFDILGLAAGPGAVLELTLSGPDAQDALEELTAIFNEAELVGDA